MKKEKGITLIVLLIIVVLIIGAIIYFTYNPKTEQSTSNKTVNQTSNTIDAVTSKENIILYDGVEIEKTTGWINLFDIMINLSKESEKRYNTKYYNYEKNKYTGETTGTFKYENGYVFVNEVGKVAMTKKYNAIPRTSTKLNDIPNELIDMIDYSILEIESIDLDGDGKLEYIVLCGVDYARDQIGDGEPEASSTIMLLDSNFKKIADLVNIADGFTTEEKDENNKVFLSLNDIMYIDIDEDNIMEIIIKIPTYEEEEISILKYNNGKIEGDINIEAKVRP